MKSRLLVVAAAGGSVLALSFGLLRPTAKAQQSSSAPTKMSAADFERLFKQNTNWGRWGNDDVLGTINLITEQKRKQAAALVKSGVSISVAHDLSTEQAADNPRPLKREVAPNFRTDTYFFQYHGTFVTHQDALCHYTFDNHVYNERPLNTKDCFPGIDNLKNGIVTRGILIDIPRLKGVPYLEPDAAIFQKDIEAWEKMASLKVGPGDAVILRTGRWARREKKGLWNAIANAAGFDVTVAPWFKARDVALAGGDVTVEIHTDPPVVEGQTTPLHTILIAGLGMPIIDDLDPEALAEMCARLRRWEFMLVVAPLRVPNGTGSPVNPIEIF
ncbi:MAG: cyclase [Acidobacteria bacterium]|nr:MAG: cyclase [Acidobacteriota bacterium]